MTMVESALLSAALDALDIGIALVGADGRIRHCNVAYADLLAAPPELLFGSSLFGAGSPCEALTGLAAEWDASKTFTVSGESFDGTAVDIAIRPVDAGASTSLILVRRGFARAAQRRGLPAEVVADIRAFLGGLTGHVPEDAVLARAPLSILVLGIDGLVAARRDGGEAESAEAVRQVAQVLVLEKRKSDIVSHYGDSRFLVLAPDTPGPRAALLAERFRNRVDALEMALGDPQLRVRLLVSSAEYRPQLDGSIADAVERAASVLVAHGLPPVLAPAVGRKAVDTIPPRG
jgi:GGDEF domain-containing protein